MSTSRRDFLKLAGLASSLTLTPYLYKAASASASGDQPNVLIILFDALSALHLPWHGYARNTMPFLNQRLENAIVYHNHYAAGNYTTPGTASLLTGAYPWSHRAFNINAQVAPPYDEDHLFSLLPDHHRLAYTHNPYANVFLLQFLQSLDQFKPRHGLYLDPDLLVDNLLANDWDAAAYSRRRIIDNNIDNTPTSSLFLTEMLKGIEHKTKNNLNVAWKKEYPRGLPSIDVLNYFLLEDAIDWTLAALQQLPQPFLGYFHYFPPHDPYKTRVEFTN